MTKGFYLIFFNFLTFEMIKIAIPIHMTWTAATDARIVTQVILFSSNQDTNFSPHPSCKKQFTRPHSFAKSIY